MYYISPSHNNYDINEILPMIQILGSEEFSHLSLLEILDLEKDIYDSLASIFGYDNLFTILNQLVRNVYYIRDNAITC